MRYSTFSLSGELWVAYPMRMRFPLAFSHCYPFRGRGIVSRILYWLNRIRLDGLLLGESKTPPFVGEMKDSEMVAFFWPSKKRSEGRFYGYKVDGRKISEYWKIGITQEERKRIRQESENVGVAGVLAEGGFRVAQCRGVEEGRGFTLVRYDPLPEDAIAMPLTDEFLEKVKQARLKIALAGYQHGDLGCHNIKVSNGEIWILDWEEMNTDLPRLTDEISFNAMLGYYNKGLRLEDVWREICDEHSNDMNEVIAALKSMKARNIAMGSELLSMFESEVK